MRTSLKAAVLSFRQFNLVALATIVVTAVVIDGPLLQRASSTTLVERIEKVSVNITIAREAPFGYSGIDIASDNARKANSAMPTSWFLRTLQAYNQRDLIPASPGFGCQGTCTGEIEAAGLWKEYTEQSETFSWSNQSGPSNGTRSRRVFGIDWDFVTKSPPITFLSYGS